MIRAPHKQHRDERGGQGSRSACRASVLGRVAGNALPSLVMAGFAVAVAIAIFLLTAQGPDDTISASSIVNVWLAKVFGRIPGLYDPQTGLWLGIGVRHWAHTAEFWLLGLFVSLSAYFALRPRLLVAGGVSFAVCVAFSLFDQTHKLFVPGRHFDGFDLAMDALGYGLVIAIVFTIGWILKKVTCRG